jgi:uncharacterized membrane protein HdeD (DUF308 family)
MSSKAVKRNPVERYVDRTDRLALVLEGIVAVVVGLLLVINPKNASLLITNLLGLFLVIRGIAWVISIFTNHKGWGWRLAAGIGALIVGAILLAGPALSTYLGAATILFFTAAAGCVIGIVMIIWGIAYHQWGRMILGILALILGFMLVLRSPIATLAVPIVLGIAAIAAGIYAIVAAIRKPGKQEVAVA